MLFAFTFSSAQNLIDDNDISENIKDLNRPNVRYTLKNPLEFYRLKCTTANYAQFSGGENAFKNELYLNLESYLRTGFYSVNGTFELILTVSKTGLIQKVELKPEVQNSNLLQRDLELALKQMNSKFTPATCEGTPIDSRLRQKIDFHTDAFDI